MTLAVDVEADVGALKLRVALPASAMPTVVVGPNGAGKTTLLKAVLGAIKPHRGTIVLEKRTLFSARERIDVAIEDRRLGYVPQGVALFPHMTVRDNVAFGIRENRRERAQRVCEQLGIAHLAHRKAPSLSGGEAQLVALARALAIEPRALLLDEPIAGLDAGARDKTRAFIAERLREIEIPTLVVSHHVDDARALGGRMAVIEAGRITQLGTLEKLENDPATPFVERFLQRR